MLLPLAALVTGCRYDDSEVWEELNNHEQRILALEKAVNTDLASVSGIVAELQKKVYVSSVTPTANGFTLTFTDGKSYTVTNGTSGETPNIGVKQDTDGNYYWTLNGEWLKDAAGNKIRTTGDQGVAGITPQVKIENNKWYVSIDNGKTWTEAGAATVVGDSLFKEVKLDADGKNVIFTFQDGSTITIPVVPVVKKLQLIFDETQIASIMSGATATVDYEITGPEDETVEFDTFENNGYKVVVTPTDATKGTIAVTAPDPAVKGKVLFILTGSKGSSFVKTVTINANPAVTPEKTEYNVDSKAGEVVINVAANIAYTSKIVATKAEDITWITKGSAENKFVVTENATLEDRSVNIVFSAEGVKDVTVKLTQACKDAIVVTAEDLSKEIAATEGTLDIVIRTNVEVTATPDVDWIVLDEGTKALADKKFSFKIAANTGSARVGHIDFTAGELKQTITVTQGAGPMIPDVTVTLPYAEAFTTGIGKFAINNVTIPDALKEKGIWTNSSSYGMVGSGFLKPDNYDADAWLYSPIIDLGSFEAPFFQFDHAVNYFSSVDKAKEEALVWIREIGKDWTKATVAFPTSLSYTYISSGQVDLSSYKGKKIQIAFEYISTATKAGTWEIKNFIVDDPSIPIETTVSVDDAGVEVGKTATLKVNTNNTAGVKTFESENQSVATVDEKGVVTGVGVGITFITVKIAAAGRYTENSAKCTVTVTESAGGVKKFVLDKDAIKAAHTADWGYTSGTKSITATDGSVWTANNTYGKKDQVTIQMNTGKGSYVLTPVVTTKIKKLTLNLNTAAAGTGTGTRACNICKPDGTLIEKVAAATLISGYTPSATYTQLRIEPAEGATYISEFTVEYE